MQDTYQDFFSLLKIFLNSSILMSFSTSAIFCFTSSMLAKHFPFEDLFFYLEKQKEVTQGKLGE